MEGIYPAFETIRDQLMPIIERSQTGVCAELIPDQLYVAVGFKSHEGLTRVTQEHLQFWDTHFHVVLEISQWNLRRKTPANGWTDIVTVDGLSAYVAKDGLSSSRVLCLQDLVRPWPFEGVLIAMPTRDQLLVLPLDRLDVLQSMRIMVLAGDTARENGTHPLSDQLFWFDGEQWEWIQVSHLRNQIEIQPSGRFMDALERITAVNLVPVAAEA